MLIDTSVWLFALKKNIYPEIKERVELLLKDNDEGRSVNYDGFRHSSALLQADRESLRYPFLIEIYVRVSLIHGEEADNFQ